METTGRRRIDRILDPGFVEDLPSLTPDELRRRLRETQEELDDLDFVRRLLHGKLDILGAEVQRRRGSGEAGSRIVDELARILAGRDAPRRGGRPRLGQRERRLARRVERLASEDHLLRLPEMGDEELAEVVETLQAAEREVSAQRAGVLSALDALQEELIRRYQAGEASPELP